MCEFTILEEDQLPSLLLRLKLSPPACPLRHSVWVKPYSSWPGSVLLRLAGNLYNIQGLISTRIPHHLTFSSSWDA